VIGEFDRICRRLEAVADNAAAGLMFVTMLIVVTDVLLRYFFNSPLTWVYDVASMYLMVGLFYLALAPTLAARAHIGVDLLVQFMSSRTRHICQVVGCALSAVFFIVIALVGAKRAWGDFVEDAVTSGVIPWPTWISVAFVPLGSTLISLRLILLVIIHLQAALNKGDAPLDPLGPARGGFE
jgi:TRAP-type C4-dicarboxylate transport system permease small subunit